MKPDEGHGMKGHNPPDRWSGEALRKGERYLTTQELDRRKFVVGRLVHTDEGWFLEKLER